MRDAQSLGFQQKQQRASALCALHLVVKGGDRCDRHTAFQRVCSRLADDARVPGDGLHGAVVVMPVTHQHCVRLRFRQRIPAGRVKGVGHNAQSAVQFDQEFCVSQTGQQRRAFLLHQRTRRVGEQSPGRDAWFRNRSAQSRQSVQAGSVSKARSPASSAFKKATVSTLPWPHPSGDVQADYAAAAASHPIRSPCRSLRTHRGGCSVGVSSK